MLENNAYFPGHTATSSNGHGNSRSRGNSPAAIRSTSSNTIRNNSSTGTSTHDSASKLTKKNTKRNTDSRKSPSTSSPDQQGYTSNSGGSGSGSKSKRSENNLRERLSPAAQRFVTESSDFTASTSVMRRLPSPVLTRHSSSSRNTNNGSSSYNNNYGNLRSPSADAAVRRSFDVTSMENLAETARNINYHQQLSKPLIVTGEKHHHTTSNSSSGRTERVNTSSTSMILQERLKEAQKAFAAMRETY